MKLLHLNVLCIMRCFSLILITLKSTVFLHIIVSLLIHLHYNLLRQLDMYFFYWSTLLNSLFFFTAAVRTVTLHTCAHTARITVMDAPPEWP